MKYTIEQVGQMPVGTVARKADSVIHFVKTAENTWRPLWQTPNGHVPVLPIMDDDTMSYYDIAIINAGREAETDISKLKLSEPERRLLGIKAGRGEE